MKFIGLYKGETQMLEDVDPSKLKDMKSDFSWIDADKIDPKTESAIQNLCGIPSLNDFNLPVIVPHGECTVIVIKYYSERVRHSVSVIVSKERVITIHPGTDAVCEEVMASVTEMLVSGDFNSGTVLRGLFAAAIEHDTEYLRSVQESLRNVEVQMRAGVTNITQIPQMMKDSGGIQRTLNETKDQISEILLGVAQVSGTTNAKAFYDVYDSANALSALAGEFSEAVAAYESELLLSIWKNIGKARRIALGLPILSISLSIAALFYVLFPLEKFGVPSLYITLGIAVVGAFLAVASSSRKMKFKAS